MEKVKQEFLPEFEYLRGISIFLIVFCHVYGWIVLNSNSKLIPHVPNNHFKYFISYEEFLIFGATSFFVFISGFLFYHIFYKRGFDYKKFLISKFKNVMCPYLLLTTIFAFIRTADYTGELSCDYWINQIFLWHSFWYVPFIMFVFLCSPLYIKFIESTQKVKIITLIIALLYSVFTARHNGNPILSMLFWSSFYLLGILSSIHYEKIKNIKNDTKICIFLSCIILTTLALAINVGNRQIFMQGTWDFSLIFNFIIIPKIFYLYSLLYFCLYLTKIKTYNTFKKIMKIFAKYSFSIFFIHPFFIYFLDKYKPFLSSKIRNFNGLEQHALALISTLVISIICIFIAFLIKKIFNKHSRMIIGA